MSDVAISGLTALGAAPATNDLLVEVDVSDTTQAPTGTTKKMTVANLFTSPHMTGSVVDSGGLTVTLGGLTVSAGTTAVQDLTASVTLNVSSATGLALGSVGNRRRLQSTDSRTFTFLADDNSVGDLAVARMAVSATLDVTGNVSINTNKFTVAAATGNTAIAGTLIVQGATATMPLLVGIGGLTAAFPALKRSGATLEVRAADDSGYTNLNVSALSTATGDVFSQTNVTASTGVFKVGANQVVGARNTGWAAQTVTTGAKTDIGASGTWTTTSVGNLLMAHHAALLAHGLIGA